MTASHLQWWQLPGPARFLDEAVSSLRGGQSAVLALPATLEDASLHDALVARVRAAEFICSRVDCSVLCASDTPVQQLASLASVPTRASFRQLGASDDLAHHVILLHSIATTDSSFAQDLIFEFSEGAKQLEEFERGAMCVLWSAPSKDALPSESSTLELFRWNDVDRLDVLLWASLCARGSRSLEKQLRIHTAVELASADPWLAECIVNCLPLSEPLVDTLQAYAEAQGWSPSSACVWELGTEARYDGEVVTHSGLLAVRECMDQLERRRWRAQQSVLFPYFEGERLRLAQSYAQQLRLPMDTPWGTLRDPEDLELPHLRAQLRGRVAASTLSLLNDLVAARNALAHYRAVSDDLLPRVAKLACAPSATRKASP